MSFRGGSARVAAADLSFSPERGIIHEEEAIAGGAAGAGGEDVRAWDASGGRTRMRRIRRRRRRRGVARRASYKGAIKSLLMQLCRLPIAVCVCLLGLKSGGGHPHHIRGHHIHPRQYAADQEQGDSHVPASDQLVYVAMQGGIGYGWLL